MHAEGVSLEGDESAAELRGDVPVPRLVPYVEGAVPILVPVSQAGVAVDLVVVIEYLELQSLELYRPYRPPIAHVTKNVPLVRLRVSRRRTTVFFPKVLRAVIYVVGEAIAIAIWRITVRAAMVRISGFIGAHVIRVSHAIAVPVGAAVELQQARLKGATVVYVANPVAITVGAATVLQQAKVHGAVVLLIRDAIAVPVPRRGTAIMPRQAGFIRTGIYGIGHAISIPVGATFCHRRAGFIGALVGPIEEAIAI
jgi:hypothetical protein